MPGGAAVPGGRETHRPMCRLGLLQVIVKAVPAESGFVELGGGSLS